MRIAFITAGAAGMYCGSCMRDNTLVAALRTLGHDAVLIPTYTPIKTDEEDVSQDRVFFGGVNVYLEQKFRLFRHTPWFLDRVFNFRWLLKWVSRFASRTNYSELGSLAISMLQGTHGHQRKEVKKLAAFLAEEKPDVILFTNALLSGAIPDIKKAVGVPILVTLQGDDIFLDALPEQDRQRCIELIRDNGHSVDGYISTSQYYADHMASYLGIDRDRIHVVPPGINTSAYRTPAEPRIECPRTIGYFARICPEKGFHRIIDAFIRLRNTHEMPNVKLKVGGWLGENFQQYFADQVKRLEHAGLRADFEYVHAPKLADKIHFMQSLDVLCVPSEYREPKGLYVLEAWAAGVPVVLPAHGVFTELVESSGAGLLVAPDSTDALADGLQLMLTNTNLRDVAGRAGKTAVGKRFSAEAMARETISVISRYLPTAAVRSS